MFCVLAVVAMAITALSLAGCRFARSYDDSDTVAASEFEPEDTAAAHRRAAVAARRAAPAADSVGIYYIGDGSTRRTLQLVSYPSHRDTVVYGKTRHVRVRGCADIGKVVRVGFSVTRGGDSLVSDVEQIEM